MLQQPIGANGFTSGGASTPSSANSTSSNSSSGKAQQVPNLAPPHPTQQVPTSNQSQEGVQLKADYDFNPLQPSLGEHLSAINSRIGRMNAPVSVMTTNRGVTVSINLHSGMTPTSLKSDAAAAAMETLDENMLDDKTWQAIRMMQVLSCIVLYCIVSHISAYRAGTVISLLKHKKC